MTAAVAIRWRVFFRCELCAFETSRPLGDFSNLAPTEPKQLACTNCSADLDAYDAGDGNDPAIVTDHEPVRIEREDRNG